MHVKQLDCSESFDVCEWECYVNIKYQGRYANQTTRNESYAAMQVWDLNCVFFCTKEKFNRNLYDVKQSSVEHNLPNDQR